MLAKTILVMLTAAALCHLGSGRAQGNDENQAHSAATGLAPGVMLDEHTAALAKGLLPEELLRHYERGEYKNPLVDWPPGVGTMGPEFEAQTQRNATTLSLNDAGMIVDKETGKQPPFIYGVPFPNIDPRDPAAGIKIVWNQFYVYWWNGNNRTLIDMVWLAPKAVQRKVTQDVYFKYYDGVPPDLRPAENPNNLLLQFVSVTKYPTDLHGTTALTWRYRDPHKRDSVWAYVPALRRVRAVSPANRSDGFLGSDMSQDDGPFFDGKPEDFTWKLAGERDVLRLVDPLRLRGTHKTKPLPGGGWRAVLDKNPFYGFERPGWTGVTWAPIAMQLGRRRAWIVEGTPKDEHYLCGKIQLWIDKENWQGIYNRKFSWQGELLNTLQIQSGPAAKDNGKYYTWKSPATMAQIAENVKLNRATVVAFGPHHDRRFVVYHIPLAPSFFDHETLARLGK